MIEALLGELASAGGTEIVLAAGEHLVEKIKGSHDIKKLFVETGEFFIDFEPNAEQLFKDMELVPGIPFLLGNNAAYFSSISFQGMVAAFFTQRFSGFIFNPMG